MTARTKLEVRQREIRSELSQLAGKDQITDEVRGQIKKLTDESCANDSKLNAIAVTEGSHQETQDAESRERQQLRGKVSVSKYLSSAAEMRAVDGPEGEFNAALKIGADRFPLEILAPAQSEDRTATDADAGPSAPRRWIDRLFAISAAARLGITMESVGPGLASFPVTATGSTAAQRGRGQAAPDAAWTVQVTELKPTRNATRCLFSLEDVQRIGAGLEDALTRDLRMALIDGIDQAVFKGDDSASEDPGDITGLQTAEITEATLSQANKLKGPQTLAQFVGMVDGKHADSAADLRIVTSVGANTLWSTTMVNAAASNETVAQFLRASGLNWSVRADIDTTTTNGKFGAFVGRGRGIEGAGVAAIWDSASLIRDPYSGAAKGEVALTMNYLWAFGLPRTASFQRVKFVT